MSIYIIVTLFLGWFIALLSTIDFFNRYKMGNKYIIIEGHKGNIYLGAFGTLLVLISYVALFWYLKWWIVIILLLTYKIQGLILITPIAIFIKAKLYKDFEEIKYDEYY